jgi:hypothetical protein
MIVLGVLVIGLGAIGMSSEDFQVQTLCGLGLLVVAAVALATRRRWPSASCTISRGGVKGMGIVGRILFWGVILTIAGLIYLSHSIPAP